MKDEKILVRFLKLLLCCLIVFLGVSSYAKAAPLSSVPRILYVKSGGTSVNCTSWDDACDLQTALSKASSGDQVWVAAGIYRPTTGLDPLATFQLESGVAIYGGFPAPGGAWAERNWLTNPTTLSGDIGDVGSIADNSYHVVTGSGVDATAVLDGFTISGGNANGSSPNDRGGGMYNSGSNPTLTNVTFSGNSAISYGGGMFNQSSSPRLTDVTFSGNLSSSGGGMSNYYYSSNPTLINVNFSGNSATNSGGGMANYSSSARLTNVTFSGNSSLEGGGMINYSSSLTLTNVTFSGNTASYSGGGMNNNSSSPVLNNVTFSGNSADKGGGMYNLLSSNPTLTNVTFSNNTASNHGGGIYNFVNSSPILTNVTFSENSAVLYGGGISNAENSHPTLTNAIVWGNRPDTEPQIYNDGVSFPTITYSDIQGGGYPDPSNINADPHLGGLADNDGFTQTHALGDKSPAIDTANPAFCPTYDQRYFVRPIDGGTVLGAVCDMGAFEYGSSVDGFTLTVETEGSGTFETDPPGPGYRYGDVVTLTATPEPRWIFGGWSGGATGTINPLIITIDRITKITATFTQDEYSLTTTVNPAGMGSINVEPVQGTYHYGDVVTLTPTPTTGWTFSHWSGATVTDNKLTITGNTTVTANFSDQYTLSAIVDRLGSGTVTRNPDQPTYTYGTQVALTANPNPGWTFSGWNGDPTSTDNPKTVTIKGNTTVTANFSDQYTLSTTVEPTESGTVTRDLNQDTYTYGTPVTLTATANSDWTFTGWSGDATGTDNPLTIKIGADTSITANFSGIYKLYLPLVMRN